MVSTLSLGLLTLVPLLLALPFLLDRLLAKEFRVHSSGVVVVTGASTGIGRHAAQFLASRGYTVLAGVRKQSDFDEIEAGRREGRSPNMRALFLDVTSSDSITAAVDEVTRLLDSSGLPLVALVNNAGVGSFLVPLELLPTEEMRHVMNVNFFGALETSRAFIPLLRQHQGRVIMISSAAGKICMPGFSSYCATKFALEGMSDSLRLELGPLGVSVSVVEPGFIRTPIMESVNNRVDSRPESSIEWYRTFVSGGTVMVLVVETLKSTLHSMLLRWDSMSVPPLR